MLPYETRCSPLIFPSSYILRLLHARSCSFATPTLVTRCQSSRRPHPGNTFLDADTTFRADHILTKSPSLLIVWNTSVAQVSEKRLVTHCQDTDRYTSNIHSAHFTMWRASVVALTSLAFLPSVLGSDILRTNGFSNCNNGTSTLTVNNVDIAFDKNTNKIDFDVSGTSSKEQFVTADLVVTAYGIKVYNNSFDPCAADTKVDQLCPGKSRQYPAWNGMLTPTSPGRNVRRQRNTSHSFVLYHPHPLDRILTPRSRRKCSTGAQSQRWIRSGLRVIRCL